MGDCLSLVLTQAQQSRASLRRAPGLKGLSHLSPRFEKKKKRKGVEVARTDRDRKESCHFVFSGL